MRDRSRIPELCDLLMVLWQTNAPDLRFGQLVNNLTYYIHNNCNGQDIFYVEDEDMKSYLVEYFNSMDRG